MKSSHNLNPSARVQNWSPADFVQNLFGGNNEKEHAESTPSPFFEDVPASGAGNSRSDNLIHKEATLDLKSWSPPEFNIPNPEKADETWTPILRYNAAAAAADTATQILNDARKQANELLRNAEAQASAMYEKAYQEGINEAAEEMAKQIETTKNLVAEATTWRDHLMLQSEPIVLDIIRTIAQKLFGDGFVLDANDLQNAFNRTLENARSLGNLRVYVNPEDARLLGPYWREMQESITSHKVEVIPSPSISRGGCYVNGQWGTADGRMETQLKAVLETLVPDEEKDKSERGE